MSGVWDAFNTDINAYLDLISQSIEKVFRDILRATIDTCKWSAAFFPITEDIDT